MAYPKGLTGDNSKEKRLWVRLTRTCNNNCIFCLDKEMQDGTCISLAVIRKKLCNGIKDGLRRVVLSGGEPTLHPQFIKIIELAKKAGYRHIQVITNGRMFSYRDFLRQCVDAGINEATFSLHGFNENGHDKLTGVNGSFRQSLAGLINALNINGLIVSVDIVINKMNVKKLEKIVRFFMKLGVSEFDLLQITPAGSAWKNRRVLFYDVERSLSYLRGVFLLSQDRKLHLWTNRFPAKYLEGFENLIQDPNKLYDEIKGREDAFKGLLRYNKQISCFGQRCAYCFLKDFCTDLKELKHRRLLTTKNLPLCLPEGKYSWKNAAFSLDRKTGIYDFLDFYIRNRYFVKSPRCKNCQSVKKCCGLPIEYAMKYGLRLLNPVLA